MNVQRAEEIASSPIMADVTFNNRLIYIQHVDKDSQTARIFPLDQPENELEVSLAELNEH